MDVAKRCNRILEVLQHIQHQDEGVLLAGLKVSIKRANVNPVSIRIGRIQQVGKWLKPFDIAEFAQARKKQSVTATDVEDARPAVRRPDAPQCLNNKFTASAPPPVLFKQLSV